MSTSDRPAPPRPPEQRTLKSAISCVGVGVHSGRRSTLRLRPAPAGHGVVFRRTDLGCDISARFDHVVDTRLCTVLANPARPGASVGTVEHLMAALAGSGITNILAEIDGPEVPILDGSAAPFMFLFDCAGVVAQDAPVPVIEVLRPVRVQSGAAWAELRPGFQAFDLSMAIEFAAGAIGRQDLALRATPEVFRTQLARARTFALAEEVQQLQSAGLARGGSLENAIVVDGERVLNPAGLRMCDEFVRHKMVDAIGDLALAGGVIRGRFAGHRSGHALNNALLHALFSDSANWSGSAGFDAASPRAPVAAAA